MQLVKNEHYIDKYCWRCKSNTQKHDNKINIRTETLFEGMRWALLSICIICFIASIVSLSFRKAAIKQGFVDKNRHIKKFDVTALVFSILGIGVASIVLLIF